MIPARTPAGKKICVDCGKPKPATKDFFYALNHTKSGKLYARCKPCESRHRKRNGRGIYDRIARAMGITRQRVHQIEASALQKLVKNPIFLELTGQDQR